MQSKYTYSSIRLTYERYKMNMLEEVRERMNAKGRQMKSIAEATGINYFTIQRVRAGKGCPCYHVVQKLHDHFFPKAKDESADQA